MNITLRDCVVLEPFMRACARRDIVDEDCVGVYHCIARCVRSAFLCGSDPDSGRDYSHRRPWIVDRLRQLAGLFGVEVCEYAVMSNRLHLVLRNRPDLVRGWSDAEVALKYIMLLDWTGRELRRDKRGAIPENLAPILDRLGIDRSNWVDTVRDFGRMFKQAAGRASSLARAAPRCSRRWFQGKAAARVAFL